MEKVSLILTTYNSAENLLSTLESISQQDYLNIEVVIKDGGSTDSTISIVRDFIDAGKLNIIWTVSGDKGIYDAMNQGFALSTGDIVAFFNDKFTDKRAVSKLVNGMNSQGNYYDGVHADLIYCDGERVVRYWKMGEGAIEKGWLPGHPTLFLRRKIYEKYGLYKTAYRISADYEFMIRILKNNGVNLAYVPETLVEMFYGGTSNGSLKSYLLSLYEGHRALKENKIPCAWLINVRRTIRVLAQFIIKSK